MDGYPPKEVVRIMGITAGGVRLPLGQRLGLVRGQDSNGAPVFQVGAILDQHAATGGLGAIVLHLVYGAFWGGVLHALTGRITLSRGVALDVGLWLIMQLAVLPFLGWGLFGVAQTPKIELATLVLHLVYGGTLGALADRGKATVAEPV